MTDRQFGRRAPVRGNAAPPASPPEISPGAGSNGGGPPDLVQVLNSRGVRQIGGILLGVAIVFGIITFYVSGMKMAGRALDRQWAENAGYPALDNPPASRTDAGSTYNELRTTCKARADKVQLSRAMRDELELFVNIRVGEVHVERHVEFIDCLMTSLPGRFCQAEHRAHLVDAIRTYFRLRMRVREEWAMMRNNPFSASGVGLVRRPGSDGISARYPSERTDPRIIAGLTTLITDGYLTRADLGAGMFSRMPGDLEELLKGVERKNRSCG